MVAKTPEDFMHRTNKSVSNSHRLHIGMSFFDGDSGKLPNFGLLLPIKLIRAELVTCRLLIRIFYHETQKHGKFYVTNVFPYLSLSLFFSPWEKCFETISFSLECCIERSPFKRNFRWEFFTNGHQTFHSSRTREECAVQLAMKITCFVCYKNGTVQTSTS